MISFTLAQFPTVSCGVFAVILLTSGLLGNKWVYFLHYGFLSTPFKAQLINWLIIYCVYCCIC